MTDDAFPTGPETSVFLHDSIDVSTPAIVTWDPSNFLGDVTFDLRRVSSSNDAFFKLRATVVLKADASSKTALFVHIQPERIISLALDNVADDQLSAHQVAARRKLGKDLTCLRFALTQPPDLIGPRLQSLTPKNKASGDILDSLRSLACQRHFAIYFSQKALLKSRLVSLCESATTGVLKTNARQADLSSLYRGKGGEVIVVQKLSPAAGTSCDTVPPHGSPPSYNELDPSPPPAPGETPRDVASSKKRRRSSSDDLAPSRLDPADIERMCRKIVDDQKAEMLQVIDEQQNKLYDRLLGDLKPYISQELEKLEARILDQVDRKSGKQVEQQEYLVEKQLDVLRDEVEDTINSRINDVDERVEDQFYGLRLRLEDFVKEEVAEAQEKIVEHLESAATISFS